MNVPEPAADDLADDLADERKLWREKQGDWLVVSWKPDCDGTPTARYRWQDTREEATDYAKRQVACGVMDARDGVYETEVYEARIVGHHSRQMLGTKAYVDSVEIPEKQRD